MDMRDVVGIAIAAVIFFGIKALIEYINASPSRKAKAENDARLAKMAPGTDAIEALGNKVDSMTVAEIAAATGKTSRGTITALIRRGITVADFDGAAKKAEIEASVSKY